MTIIAHTPIADVSAFRRLISEVWHGGALDAIPELFDEGYVGHDPCRPVPRAGHHGLRDHITTVRVAFPDVRFEIDDVVVSGDRIAYRCVARATHTGMLGHLAPTGRRVTVAGLEIMRFGAIGRVVEQWSSWDALGLLRQLGAVNVRGGLAGFGAMTASFTEEDTQ